MHVFQFPLVWAYCFYKGVSIISFLVKDPEGLSEGERELKNLKDQFHDDFPVGPLIGKCCTVDQVNAEDLYKSFFKYLLFLI